MVDRYICIHGHFYQPPRENPWLEEIELQDSSYPYHDWNTRITAESYAPNAVSRILDREKKIIDIVNNYSKISFNFGPTLFSWMEKHEPETYRAILTADKESRKIFSGHGSAIAQVYNHMIMPLANRRDKGTQISWGIKDFENRFRRMPEGMWLAETAVDSETLDILAESGIRFTILSPGQIKRWRKTGGEKWTNVDRECFNCNTPYSIRLPSGRSITVFFYNGRVSHDVAFNGLLRNGEDFAKRLIAEFVPDKHESQLVHIATDGETYGHHHRFGDMALAYCLYYIESNKLAKRTVYGEYLEKNPPLYEAEIHENSSWSCVHGVERWKSDCGCDSGGRPDWHQKWRAPLRGAMDWLSGNLALIYAEGMSGLITDPWKARDDYIDVVLDRSGGNIERFFSSHARGELSREQKIKVLKLLEMQRNGMLMSTSCGWFFDDISGIETVQVIQYASRAIQLAKETGGVSLEKTYVSLLERAVSNIKHFKNGAEIYKTYVTPAVVDLLRVAAHYAISSFFEDYPASVNLYGYNCVKESYERMEGGKRRFAVGRVKVRSDITREEDTVDFAVLHLGDQNFIGKARFYSKEEDFSLKYGEIKNAFAKSDISEVIRLMEKYFDEHSYTLWHLFKDEQRKVLNQMFDRILKDIEISFRKICEEHYPVMQMANKIEMPLPGFLTAVAEFVFNLDVMALLKSGEFDPDQFKRMVKEVDMWRLNLDRTTIGFVTGGKMESLMKNFFDAPHDLKLLGRVRDVFKGTQELSLDINLWKIQNMYFDIGGKHLDEMKHRFEKGDETAEKWVEDFIELGEFLGVRIG